MGKTTFVVKLIATQFVSLVDEIIVMCPTFNTQKTFDPIRKLVDEKNIWTGGNKNDFSGIHRYLKTSQDMRIKRGLPQKRVLILVDDMAGTNAIHGGRFSPFAHLAIQTPHLNCSLIVITQQPTSVSPSFRDNCEGVMVFPSEGILEVDWLKRSYQSLMMEENQMQKIILSAWRGGRKDNEEWGLHFLFIECLPRKHSRFWIDFEKQICV